MKINFGKYKGKTVEEIASDDNGRQYLGWLVNQPTEGKYKEQNDKRNDFIRSVLSGTSTTQPTPSVPSNTDTKLEAIIETQERILEQLQALKFNGKVEEQESWT